MSRIKILGIIFAIAAIIIALLSYTIPIPDAIHDPNAFIQDEQTFQNTLATSALFATLSLGAAILFILGLKGFTTAFRRSYYIISAGLIAQCIGNIVYLIFLFRALVAPDLAIVFGELGLTIGVLLTYTGLWRFSKILQVRTWLANLPVIIGLFIVAIGILWQLPHGESPNELTFDIGRSLFLTETVFYAIWAFLALRIKQVANPAYATSLRWLAAGGVTVAITSGILLGTDYLTYPDWLSLDFISIPLIAAYFCYLMAGISFNRVIYGQDHVPTHGNPNIDSILYLASLASRPSEIDPILDKLRAITATRQSGDNLTAQEEQTLHQVRHDLEEYLVTKERVRSFQQRQLQDLLQERFGIQSS